MAINDRLFPGGKSYPWVTPPPGFFPIDRNRFVNLAPASGETLLESIIMPGSNYTGWIVQAGIVLANPGPTRFFTIKQGGNPLRDYVSVQVPLGQPDLMGPMLIPLQQNVPTELYATNTSAVALGVRYRLFGWYYMPSEGA